MHGHRPALGRPTKVVEAITRQANALIHICGSDFYYPSMVELMEKLSAHFKKS